MVQNVWRELGGSAPFNATVGVASAVVVLPVNRRSKIVFTNDSDTVIYLARADQARINAGIRLNAAGGSFVDEPDTFGRIYCGPWSAISTAATKNLCISQDL